MCWVRNCTNANHIELVPHVENIRRQRRLISVALWRVRALISATTSDNVRGVPLNLNTPYSEVRHFLIASPALRDAKVCTICRKPSHLSNFYRIRDVSATVKDYSYLSSYCKPCHSARCVQNEKARKARKAAENG